MKGETAWKTNAILAISYEVKSGIGQGETGKTDTYSQPRLFF